MNLKPRNAPEPPPVPGARWIQLTQDQFALVDETDFLKISQFTWYHDRGYALRNYRTGEGQRRILKMHQFVLGVAAPHQVDHHDGNGLNNRRYNLRVATHAQNQQNHGSNSNNESGYKGVSFYKRTKKWRAEIQADGRHIWIGYFNTPEEAARAYDVAAREHHKEFACTNFKEAS